MERFFEDYTVGDTFTTAQATMELDEILEFARKFDPQVFHLDEEAAKRSIAGGIIASGWHTAAVMMRLIVNTGFFNGTLGLGIDDLRWRRPVRPGDRIHVIGEVIETRASTTKPVGIVRLKMTTRNQEGEDVMTLVSIVRPARRP